VISRFEDRAKVVSALTQAILRSAGTPTATVAQEYGTPRVGDELLDRAAAQGHLAYAALLDAHGGIIAASRALGPRARAQVLDSSTLPTALAGAPVSLSDVRPGGPGGDGVIQLTVSFTTASGRRVLVSALPSSLLGRFLGSYLRQVPTRDGTAYVLDRAGAVVGGRDARQRVGHRVDDPGLVEALRSRALGPYGNDGYYVAVPVPTTTWRVVLTSARSSLFSSVSGTRKWLPWIILAVLALAATGLLAVLRRLLSSAAALRSANDQLTAGNAQLESANRLLRHAAELARSNAELEQFASIASHDLQEPLRKVQTFAAQLVATERERLSEEGQDFLDRMSRAAARMRALIDDLLMYSRVSTAGRPFAAVDLDEVVAQALSDLELRIDESHARIDVGELPTINADPVQMGQMMLNLIGNALKFRRPDVDPEVRLAARVVDGIAEITVRDNGIGFDEQYATRIFRAFERLNGASAYPGTGIGLALCRKIVDRHHGTVTAESVVGQGSTFTIRLPVDQAEADRPDPAPARPEDEVTHAYA
jgi:signal transduction histidine kinase